MQALRRACVSAGAARNGIFRRHEAAYPDTNILWPGWMHRDNDRPKPTFETAVWEQIFEENRVLLVWHVPSMTMQQFDEARYALFKLDIGLKRGGKKDMHPFLLTSKFKNMSRLMQPEYVVCYTNDTCIKAITKALKPFPLTLLGGCIDRELLTRDQVLALSTVTNIKDVQSELIGVLSTPAYLLSAYLGKHAAGPEASAE